MLYVYRYILYSILVCTVLYADMYKHKYIMLFYSNIFFVQYIILLYSVHFFCLFVLLSLSLSLPLSLLLIWWVPVPAMVLVALLESKARPR